jgi:hypothetical protein
MRAELTAAAKRLQVNSFDKLKKIARVVKNEAARVRKPIGSNML